jgi:diguanylate cyclase (GGDEF)-like protein
VGARSGQPARLLAVIIPVCLTGLITLAWSAYAFTREPHTARTLIGFGALVLAAMFAERFQVPVEGAPAGSVSLLYVFTVATIVLFGWHAGALLAAIGTFTQVLQHRPVVRVTYNAAVFGFSAAVAGLAITWLDTDAVGQLLAAVGIASVVDYWVNMLLITLVVAVHSKRSFVPLVVSNTNGTILPFALMGSAALMLVVLWQRSPILSAALVGPLLAISLYQRSTHRALRAMRLALTDPLTGLGNHRHFHERLQRELVVAEEESVPLSLCLIDVDDFKRINDNNGHPAGDRVLSQVAGRLRQGGEAFRLGGDEFAVLLPNHDEVQALDASSSIIDRLRALELEHAERITASAGVATFPVQGVGRDELIRLADSALYWAKENGKNRVRIYRSEVVELAELKRLASTGADRAARFRAAAALAKAVDARDVYTGSHSERVSELAVRIAERMSLEQELVELTRLAASLHDLGKLAIPEEILRKPGPLTEAERLVLERHPQIGYRMLESLGVNPVADWVLHHHERWDGDGYPEGLEGDEIPLGARIIFVADALDAMSHDRVYSPRLDLGSACAELERCAGTQFDPDVVAACITELSPPLASVAS